jgi:hypothetical protein
VLLHVSWYFTPKTNMVLPPSIKNVGGLSEFECIYTLKDVQIHANLDKLSTLFYGRVVIWRNRFNLLTLNLKNS